MVVFQLVEEFDKCVEEEAEKEEPDVDKTNYQGVDFKASKYVVIVFGESNEREIFKCHFQVEHIEIVYAMPVSVQQRPDNEDEDEITRKAYPRI